MKNYFLFLPLLLILSCSQTERSEYHFFVSPQGNDNWSGELAEINRKATDGPFATLERARQAVRQARKAAPEHSGEIVVEIKGGRYFLNQSFSFSEQDGGDENRHIIWRAASGDTVRLIGGKAIDGFAPVRDGDILDRLEKDARRHVLMADLDAMGIEDTGELKVKGFAWRPRKPLASELFFRHKPMTLARYPNHDWLLVAAVPQHGAQRYHEGNADHVRDGIPLGRHYGRIRYEGSRPETWQEPHKAWMHGFWTWDWADSYTRIDQVLADENEIVIAKPYGRYGYTKGQRYYYLNILEELDEPGEYYIDRDENKLYFWPPSDIETSEVILSLVDEPLIQIDNVSFLSLENLIIECGRSTGISMSGGEQNRIAGCTLRNLGDDAIQISGGTSHRVQSCDIYDVAARGILLEGGDRLTLAHGNHIAENNHITRYSRIYRTNSPAIDLRETGNTARHNEIHNAPHTALFFFGNEHTIEYNEIYDIAQETGDVGAFYIGRDWSMRGHQVEFNYFHDFGTKLASSSFTGVMAVYLDDLASGVTVYGNLFERAGRGVMIGGGRDNRVENNLFIDCEPAVMVDERGKQMAKKWIDGTDSTLYKRMQTVDYQHPPYSVRYPQLINLYQDDPGAPKGNVITGNVVMGGRFLDLHGHLDLEQVEVTNNVIQTDVLMKRSADARAEALDYRFFHAGYDPVMQELESHGNHLTDSPPLRWNPKTHHLDFPAVSPVHDIEFEPIPVDKIGLYPDAWRQAETEGPGD